MMNGRPIEILLVEDNPADVNLTISALRDARILNQVHAVADGEEALNFLRCKGKYGNAPPADIVFLDLNIPKVDGHQVLAAMKADENLRRIPVVVISSSDNPIDIEQAYEEQVSFYIVKPLDVDQYFSAIRSIKQLFFHVVTLPAAKKASSSN